MKKLIIFSLAMLAILCLLTSCTDILHTKTETTVISCSRDETLHVDTKVKAGVITIQVTAPDGTVCFEKELSKDYDCGINIYSPGEYTVNERWDNARGYVKIYQTITVETDYK